MTYYPFEFESIMDHINDLKREIEYLKEENVQLTNELYEVQNRIDAILYNSITALKELKLNEDLNGII